MPCISVIVPVYNAEKYLDRCIKSILNQTFRDFELILIDDGSTDQSGKICDQLKTKLSDQSDSIAITVIHQKNAGQSVARNRGVALAAGEWVSFIDSDDYVHPQLLELLYRGVSRNSVKISMCDTIFDAAHKNPDISLIIPDDEKISQIDEAFFNNLYGRDWIIRAYKNEVIWGKLISIDIIKRYPLQEGRIYEDSAIMCRWFTEAGSVAEVEYPLYFYVDNPTGTMNAAFSEKKLDRLWSLDQMEELFAEKNFQIMKERTQKVYCYVALEYEKQCSDNQILLKKIRKMRHRKVLHNIFHWDHSLKQRYLDFRMYYAGR